MSSSPSDDVTACLQRLEAGDESARDELFGHIYDDLRGLAQKFFQRQTRDQTLQPTALVHEAWMRLVGSGQQSFSDRRHFFRVAAMAMRQLITDKARARGRIKRGGDRERVSFEVGELAAAPKGIDMVELDEALTALGQLDERQCRIVELRFLAGLTVDETADVLEVSSRTVRLDWAVAKRFLAARLSTRDA